MTFFHTTLLGVLQGLGEFLPISSSGHLALMPKLTAQADQGLAYDVMLHFGTLLALAAVFAKDWLAILSAGARNPRSEEGRVLWLIALASVPGAAAGFLLEHTVETLFRNPAPIAANLIIFGLILGYADRRARQTAAGAAFNAKTALIIGAAQAIAIMPGVSRSGITITAAILLGFSRAEAVRTSFLLAMPLIAGAALLKYKHLALLASPEYLAGVAAAAAAGWVAIKFLLKYVKTNSFSVFVVYRVLLGIAILAGIFY